MTTTPLSALTFFKALSDETRLAIVLLLQHHGELCVCDLIEVLHISQPKISRHLALLRKTGILQARRQQQWMYYRLHTTLPAWCRNICNDLLAASLHPAAMPHLSLTTDWAFSCTGTFSGKNA